MTTVLWIAVAVLSAVVVFLVFALNGATRTVADLRWTMDLHAGEDEIRSVPEGLTIGSPAPVIRGAPLPGGQHLVVFADPGCGGCERLVPALLASEGFPPIVLVGRSEEGWPDPWRSGATVVFDPDEAIADAYVVGFTPQVFVVDDGGHIAARGPAESVAMVRELLDQANAITIVDPEVRRA